MSQFDYSEGSHLNLEDELTSGASNPFPARTLEPVVDPALLSIDPTEAQRDWSSTTSLSGFSSAEGSSAQLALIGNPSPGGSKSPLQLGVNFIKNFGQEKRTTRDGQPAKRRGPKPDSKPALTRRQELNRQAQRSHRERKEQYIKALESEISRLRESYSRDLSTFNNLKGELNILKEVLTEYGISWETELEQRKAARNVSLAVPAASTSGSRSSGQGFPPQNVLTPATSTTSALSPPQAQALFSTQSGNSALERGISLGHQSQYATRSEPGERFRSIQDSPMPASGSQGQYTSETQQVMEMARGIFEEDPQLGIDFVLSLERPCQEHKPRLYQRSLESPNTQEGALFSGHALMATCPPPDRLVPQPGEDPFPHQTYDLPHADLEKLLNLSRQIVSEGQLTPIEALSQLRNHNRYRSLTREDIRNMIEDLNRKVRCYGFGAVLEDFEIKDSLSGILATKVDSYDGFNEEDFMEE